MLTVKLKLKIKDPDEILSCNIAKQNYKVKAALWLVTETIAFNLENNGKGDINELKQKIRVMRFNCRGLFKKHFRNFLNIF